MKSFFSFGVCVCVCSQPNPTTPHCVCVCEGGGYLLKSAQQWTCLAFVALVPQLCVRHSGCRYADGGRSQCPIRPTPPPFSQLVRKSEAEIMSDLPSLLFLSPPSLSCFTSVCWPLAPEAVNTVAELFC